MRTKDASELRNKKYYHLAHEGSSDLSHPAMRVLLEYFKKSENILDMGCGEGTRLATLIKEVNAPGKKTEGIDASKIAISLASKKYPDLNFVEGNLENLPYQDGKFDLLYSAYVFEHLTNPEKVLKEAIRVLKNKGFFMIIAPNFGAPNRRSPNSTQNKLKKLFLGFIGDFKLFKDNHLKWKKVVPKSNKYTIDSDTTVEPYLFSLIRYCEGMGLKTVSFSSNWEVDNFSIFQLLFKLLGRLKIFPFVYWGPHLSVVFKK